jgi:rhomboid protease GluP
MRRADDLVTLSAMEDEIDFTAHTEAELVDRFGRMDPRYAPAECARLAAFLSERGYIVTSGQLGPGFAEPSPAKMQALIGSSRPIDVEVDFGRGANPFNLSTPTHNDLGFIGTGTLKVDGISIRLSGNSAAIQSGLPTTSSKMDVQLSYPFIFDVESQGDLLRFAYKAGDFEAGAITLRILDSGAADRLVALLPRERSKNFRSQITADSQFQQKLASQVPRTPATVGLVAVNILVFVATLLAGASFWGANGGVQIAWGSDFGPYTTDGDWWRLVTSLFIHFGIVHLVANILALAFIGPFVERLFGSVNYLAIYLLTGVVASFTSVSWHPDVNSAGASGAIFGILGALLAARVRAGDAFPSDIWRPIGQFAGLFILWNLYAAFRLKGIDYAAHIGGFVSGFLIGLAAARPVSGSRAYTRDDLRRLAFGVLVAAGLSVGGFWYARSAAASLSGEGLYWHTFHWFRAGEHLANSEFNAALAVTKAGKQSQIDLANRVDRDVLPFWHEAAERLSAIDLPPNSPSSQSLNLLQDVADGQVKAFELLSKGLRDNDPAEVALANQQREEVGRMVRSAAH